MLPRVLEPEVMDSVAEARDYDAMDHSEVNHRFVGDFLGLGPNLRRVLDVGTGTALIPLLLCQKRSEAHVVAVDYAESMLDLAQRHVREAGFDRRIELHRGDAKRMAFAADSFTAVISNSIVHHIPEPGLVLAEMLRVLSPGGVFFVRDLMRPESDEQVRHLVKTYAAGANAHQQQLFEASLRAALTLEEARGLMESLGIYGDAVQATSDRHWTVSATKTA
ncbi:MAG TPA: class I SAM-dependent methyltransferase [Gemmatales bacterium]|nr:class I SAM-dependent methyltransferase [Gemmatales bacterium]HMP59103.1 class I SAM-dependent methyltransferase [Gemmatales bacterium]